MSKLVEFAKRELAFMLEKSDDDLSDTMNRAMYDHCIHMVSEFAAEGHSGASAAYAANLLDKLFRFEPLRPLTGEDSEWGEVSGDLVQNNRCFHVFKEISTGRVFDNKGKIFCEPDGCCYTSSDSRVEITFPYMPKSEIVKVPKAD